MSTPFARVGGVNVKKIRKKLKLSQPQFAQKVGVSPRQVNRWEHQRSAPSRLAQQAIERLLEREPQEATA